MIFKWVSISRFSPKINEVVLVGSQSYDDSGVHLATYSIAKFQKIKEGQKVFINRYGQIEANVTHWARVPPPPTINLLEFFETMSTESKE